MSIQYKHVSVNLAAHQSAKFIKGLTDISNTACVVLFRTLVMNERVVPTTPIGKELVQAGIIGTFGDLKPWLASHLGETIELLLDTAGADLLPFAEPTSIESLGHRLVKGKSDTSRKVRLADQNMSKVAFAVDNRVLALAVSDLTLSREDRYAVALLLSEHMPKEFYFPVSYDYRGRMYYRGGVITPQGSDFLKGVLQFAEKAPIGPSGRFAIVQALADAAGFKGTKAEAMHWATVADLTALASGSQGYQAAGLACELVALNHFEGNDEDFESGVICHMDATCSGLQHAAAITGHRPTAELTNCTARTQAQGKADIYQTVADDWAAESTTQLGAMAKLYGRKMAKKAVMLSGYGAGKAKLQSEIDMFLKEQGEEAIDWADREETLFMGVLENRCVAALAVKHAVARCVKAAGDEGVSWTTHDGFTVYQSKLEGDIVQLGTFAMEFDAGWTEEANITSVAPNFVHSLDAAQMREAVRLMRGKPVAAIHDSLGVRPGDYVEAAGAVREAFTRLQGTEILESMGGSLALTGDYVADECAESSYFWC